MGTVVSRLTMNNNMANRVKERVPAWTSSQKSLSARVRNKKKTMRKLQLAIMAAALVIAAQAQASIVAFSPTGLEVIPGEPTGNDGLFFTPNTAISVTSLGYYDCGFSGFHPVGLYDASTSTLLASATVTSASTLFGSFRYESITAVSLTAGDQYAVVGFYTPGTIPDTGYYATGDVGAAPDITFNSYKYDYNNALDLPTIDYAPPIFGPNFQYEVLPVPEPTTMIAGALLLLPFGASTIRILRKRVAA